MTSQTKFKSISLSTGIVIIVLGLFTPVVSLAIKDNGAAIRYLDSEINKKAQTYWDRQYVNNFVSYYSSLSIIQKKKHLKIASYYSKFLSSNIYHGKISPIINKVPSTAAAFAQIPEKKIAEVLGMTESQINQGLLISSEHNQYSGRTEYLDALFDTALQSGFCPRN
ncbi:MAG: hypothetical protein V7L11_18445 [Nostoc sp.]|uniref:hypothetical protein n=1 Tax=Nostoc sp. TaxID=1180 RepID=UPI002FFD37E9